jgi:outer membrane protein assembly factor BamB
MNDPLPQPSPSWRSFRGNDGSNAGVLVHQHQEGQGFKDTKRLYLGGLIWGTPVYSARHGLVYFPSTNKRVYAVDAVTWSVVWSYRIFNRADSLIDSACSLSPDESQLVVPGGDGYLHALDARTGARQWTFQALAASDSQHSTGVIVNSFEGNVVHSPDGLYIYAGNDNATFYCVDARTGREVWRFKTGMMIWTVPAIVSSLVVFGCLDGCIYVLDSVSGALVAKHDTGGEVKASPVVVGDNTSITIYACNSNGHVLCLALDVEEKTIKRRWSFPMGAEVYASPALVDRTIVVAAMNGAVAALDAASGAPRWTTSVVDYTTSSPLIVRSLAAIILGNSAGRLVALDLYTGDLRGCLVPGLFTNTKNTKNINKNNNKKRLNINSSPIPLPGGTIAVGSYDGCTYRVPIRVLLSSRDPLSTVEATQEGRTHFQDMGGRYIRSFRLNAYSTETNNKLTNVAINPDSLTCTVITSTHNGTSSDNDAEKLTTLYDVRISPDGAYLNFVPRSSYEEVHSEVPIKRVRVRGTFYRRTDSWLRDRFVLSDAGAFDEVLELADDGHAISHHIANNEAANITSNTTIKCYNVAGMVVTQPTILDTYIPAALDGQGFVCFSFSTRHDQSKKSQQNEESTQRALLLPAIPDDDDGAQFEVQREPSKVVTLVGNETMLTTTGNGFTIAGMGGTITFSEFRIYGLRSEIHNEEDLELEFYAKASCLRIKGNGTSYKFSDGIVNQLCDRTMQLHVVGSCRARARPLQVQRVRHVSDALVGATSINPKSVCPWLLTTFDMSTGKAIATCDATKIDKIMEKLDNQEHQLLFKDDVILLSIGEGGVAADKRTAIDINYRKKQRLIEDIIYASVIILLIVIMVVLVLHAE